MYMLISWRYLAANVSFHPPLLPASTKITKPTQTKKKKKKFPKNSPNDKPYPPFKPSPRLTISPDYPDDSERAYH